MGPTLGARVDIAHAWFGQTKDVAKISRTFASDSTELAEVLAPPIYQRFAAYRPNSDFAFAKQSTANWRSSWV